MNAHWLTIVACAAGSGFIANKYFHTNWSTPVGVVVGAIIGSLIYVSLYSVSTRDES